MADVGKLLAGTGLALLFLGGVLWALGRAGVRGLPGDISYQSGNVRIYFPIVTCLVVSLLLSAVLWLGQWLSRR